MRGSGWCLRRRGDIKSWLVALWREGHASSLKAEEFIAEFGGLVVQPVNRTGLNFSND
ncbi:SUKH-3 domain-containing protein [Streptomyces sp. NPDC004610]|uniref:SUKH-3 domain-containing protein n=1 Tax=unclassified Streptomyces TaxID=2593676 RepID=UPI0033B64A0E